MGKIATDADPLAKSIETGAISASRLVVEAEMGVDEVANGLHSRPSSWSLAKRAPGEIKQLGIAIAVAAGQEERQRCHRRRADVELGRVGCVSGWFAGVANGCVTGKTSHSSRGNERAAMVAETIERV